MVKNNRLLVNSRNDLYLQLHPTKNKERSLKFTSIAVSSREKFWWKCINNGDHFWEASVYARSAKNGSNCPICSNQKIIHGINDLSITDPLVFSELHPFKNKELGIDITILSPRTGRRVWWMCKDFSHEWEAIVSNRTAKEGKKTGCPICSHRLIIHGINDLSTLNPELFKQVDLIKNEQNGINTKILAPSGNIKVWWKCLENDQHVWNVALNSRVKDKNNNFNGCPFCSNQRVAFGVNDLSVENYELYSELDFLKNSIQGILVDKLAPNTKKKVWWKCKNDDSHSWMATVSSRNSKKRTCPICNGTQIIHGINDLSIVSPILYSEVYMDKNYKEGITVDILAPNANKKIWWKCNKDDRHVWESTVNNRYNGKKGCPFCSNKKIIHGVNDLSVSKPELYKQLDFDVNKEFNIDISRLTYGTHKKVWWKCESGKNSHSWIAPVSKRSSKNPTKCPHCVTYRNESEFRTLFTESTNLQFKDGHVIGERELFKRDKIQIDMINHETGVIIEYDGSWSHGANELHKRTAEEGLARDADTTNTLLNAGYKVVRIRESPLQFLELQHENLFQVAFKDKDDKLPVVMSAVEALQAMGVEIVIL